MPDVNMLETYGFFDLPNGLFVSIWRDDVVSGHMRVTGIEARADGGYVAQAVHQFGDLLKIAAKRELGPGGVLNQNFEVARVPVESIERALDGLSSEQQPLFASQPAP